jgi:diacylglycerol O-acyltransferase 2, plant
MTDPVLASSPAIVYFKGHDRRICSSVEEYLTYYAQRGTNVKYTKWQSFVTVLLFMICPGFIIIVPLTILLILLIAWSVRVLIATLVIALVFAIIPFCFCPSLLGLKLFRRYLDYFDFRIIFTEPLIPASNRRFIFAAYPHGTFALGDLLSLIAIYGCNRMVFRGAAASILLRVPLLRQFLQMIGIVDASYTTLKLHLLPNENGGINIGGIADLFASQEEGVNEVIRTRKGIFKLASECGNVTVVPAYIYGNRKIFSRLADPCGCLKKISRMIRLTVTCFWGRWGLPIPRRKPLLVIVGKQIDVVRNASDLLLNRYQLDLYQNMVDAWDLGAQLYDD